MRGRENYKEGTGRCVCMPYIQGMYIVLTHTWSASTAYCVPQGYHALYTYNTCKDQQMPAMNGSC